MTGNSPLRKAGKLTPLVVVAAGLLAYGNSFSGGFFHDDFGSIPENPTIRHLWPIGPCLSPPHRGGLSVEGRPLINLSLAVNYALGGFNVWGYHALNLAVHILAGLTLFGIVRRTLHQPALRDRFGAAADELALAVAVLWTVHPLQTESVTYIVQRAESIMGLFYLLTLYCFIRGAEKPPAGDGEWFIGRDSWGRPWHGLSVAACAVGMACKEVMVTAPLMVMLYDRAFVSGSFREAWRRRWPLYLALASTWILLGFLLALGQVRTTSMNARRIGLSWWEYLATEPGVILYYLRLCVWPHPLRFDSYQWPIARTWMSILPPAVVVSVLVGASAWAWKRQPAWGFVGGWFFLILGPSSSVIPLMTPIYEHRMYLSLAAVVTAMVMGLYLVMNRRSLAVFAVVAIGLGFLTLRRNQDYRRNPHASLGLALQKADRIQEAIGEYEQALQVTPDDAETHYNLAVALCQAGKAAEAVEHYKQALRLQPGFGQAEENLGSALLGLGEVQEAIQHYRQALQAHPGYAEAHYNLGVALARSGRVPEAVGHFEEALRLEPDLAEAHYSLGLALARLGRVPEAEGQWEQALRIKPQYAEAHYNLGIALERSGRLTEAIAHYEQALRINPDNARAHYSLGTALEGAGHVAEAREHYEQALRINPRMVEAQNRLARLQTVQ
ncbi:MAG TPA: tetratricopeptide repeat protein [Verrucomicrobiae bacterium]|nr:tetratricopeptide repeat protein [Verrucomicrobiae bacterium]